MTAALAVVIPTLDEAEALPVLLDQLRRQQGIALELVVSDGGSRDATVALAERAGARVVHSPRGRGAQMNAGAAIARAPRLLFLHADSQLPAPTQLRDAAAALDAEVARGGERVAGHFALRFARRAPGHRRFYRYLEAKTALHRPGTVNGDQGLLLTAAYFRELGGFDAGLPFLEDQRLAARIDATGRWLLLPGRLVTSARRFETEGPYRRYTVMALIMGLHAAGADGFFAQAPHVYAEQSRTGRLRVGPYLGLTWRVLRSAGLPGALRILYRAGRYARENAWQPFFWCDVALERWLGRRRPFLAFHDRVFRPLSGHAVGDAVGAVLVAAWFLVVLPLAYALIDRPQRR